MKYLLLKELDSETYYAQPYSLEDREQAEEIGLKIGAIVSKSDWLESALGCRSLFRLYDSTRNGLLITAKDLAKYITTRCAEASTQRGDARWNTLNFYFEKQC